MTLLLSGQGELGSSCESGNRKPASLACFPGGFGSFTRGEDFSVRESRPSNPTSVTFLSASTGKLACGL